jgi:hypothetical protein
MSCIIYYLWGEAVPALGAKAKLQGGGAAQALDETLIDGNEIIAKFDGATELPNHHRELIAMARLQPDVYLHVADRPDSMAFLLARLEEIRARLR